MPNIRLPTNPLSHFSSKCVIAAIVTVTVVTIEVAVGVEDVTAVEAIVAIIDHGIITENMILDDGCMIYRNLSRFVEGSIHLIVMTLIIVTAPILVITLREVHTTKRIVLVNSQYEF